MGITEKLTNAKNTKWISEGMPDDEVDNIIKSAKETIGIKKELSDSLEFSKHINKET